MDSEISGLENRHAFLKLGNNVARFHFDYMDLPQNTPGFVPRKVEDDELPFDPKTLKPRVTAAAPTPDIDLEAEPSELIAEQPTDEELEVLDSYPDSLELDQEEDEPATAAFPFREH